MEEKMRALLAEELQLCATAEPVAIFQKEMLYTPMMQDNYCFIVNRNHPLAAKDFITLDDLEGYSMVCDRRNYRKEDSAVTFAKYADRIRFTEKEIDDFTIVNSAMQGDVVIRYRIWADHIDNPLLKILHSDIPAGTIGFMRKKDAHPMVENFISNYVEYYRKLQES